MPAVDEKLEYPSAELSQCPFPYLAELRREAPVHKSATRNEYVVSRREEVIHVLRNPEIFSSVCFVMKDGIMRAPTLADRNPDRVAGIQASDAPVHTRKRKLAFAHFKPSRLPAYEVRIATIVKELIDSFAGAGKVEFVSEFADLLPARVTLDILGLPVDDMERVGTWARYDGQGTRYWPEDRQETIAEGVKETTDYLRETLLDRYENPRDDMLSEFVRAHVEADEGLDLPNLIADTHNLLIGGIMTTSHMLGSTMRLLVARPDAMARVRADNGLLVRAIEESLRLESPIQWNARMVLEDTELGGTDLPAGTLVILSYASANRDDQHFDAAEEFDLDRSDLKDHLGFGHGIHFCLGAPLARMEGRVALEQLLARMPNIRFAAGESGEVVDSIATRGLKRLDLEFDVI